MTAKTYPWKDVIWGVAAQKSWIDPDFVEYTDIEETCKKLSNGFDQQLFQAIVSREVPPLNENGTVIVDADPFQLEREAYVTEEGVNKWLASRGYGFRWNAEAGTQRRQQAQLRQENVILAALVRLGIDPLRVRETDFSKADKSRVREFVLANSPDLFRSEEIFNKAWDRLRRQGKIRSA
jgi:hypothetical protein